MINKINKLSQSEFIKVFANIFENSIWIAEELYKQKPFINFEELSLKMLDIFENASKKKQLIILNAHPDLADRTKISSLTPNSKKEQSNVGLDQCTEEEFRQFKNLNDKYKKKRPSNEGLLIGSELYLKKLITHWRHWRSRRSFFWDITNKRFCCQNHCGHTS